MESDILYGRCFPIPFIALTNTNYTSVDSSRSRHIGLHSYRRRK